VRRVEKLIGPDARGEAAPAEMLHKVFRNEINRASRSGLNVALVLARSERLGKGKIGECARQTRRRLREIDTVIELSKSTLALILPHTGSHTYFCIRFFEEKPFLRWEFCLIACRA